MIKPTIFFDVYGVIIEESKGNFLPYTGYRGVEVRNAGFIIEQFVEDRYLLCMK